MVASAPLVLVITDGLVEEPATVRPTVINS